VKRCYAGLSHRQGFTCLKKNWNLCDFLILVVFLFVDPQFKAYGNPVKQKNFNAICRLAINGKTYLDGPCKYEHSGDHKDFDYFKDDRVAIACQANGSGPCYVTNPGVFGYLTPSPKGDAKLCWN
jgi:hypothetical protein